jgi:ATP-binding cassette subfamily F protein uup
LRRFGFANETHYQWVGTLSGGEKRRLQLLKVLVTNPNFLILDEPTNDLDIVTLATLESFLIDYPGCVLIVSHDRYFMDKLVDHVFVFEGQGRIKDYPGNYSDYRAWADAEKQRKHQAKPAITSLPTQSVSEAKPAQESRKLSFKEKFEYEQIEKELPLLQARKQSLEAELAGLSTEFERIQAISAELAQLSDELDSKELRWLELSEGL